MNLTISVDDKLLEKARAFARKRGISLQDLLRAQLEALVGERPQAELAREIMEQFRDHPGDSGGRAWRREDAYEGRL